MEVVNLVSNLRERSTKPIPNTIVERLVPSDFPSIEAFSSITVSSAPSAFHFYVPEHSSVTSLRISGTSFLQNITTGKCMLVRPGTTVLYSPGRYATIFGRGTCHTLFMSTASLVQSSRAALSKATARGPSLSTIDLASDPLYSEILHFLAAGSRSSYFRFATLFYSLLDRATRSNCSVAATFGLHLPSGEFARLCEAVIADPSGKWSTAVAAEYSGYSMYHFSRKFKLSHGMGFLDFVNLVRITKVVRLMKESEISALDAIKEVGFSSLEKSTRLSKAEFGFTLAEITRLIHSQQLHRASRE